MARRQGSLIQYLDEALLARVLSFIDVRERLVGPALVCRRWRALSTSCPLLRDLTVSLPHGDASSVLPRLRSLLPWLLRHAAEPRSLNLVLWRGEPCAAPPSAGNDAAEVVALLNSCAIACTSLERLCIAHSGHYVPNGWSCALRGLREVRLRSRSRLHLLTTWEGLTALRSLELAAASIVLAPGVALPTSLTALALAKDQGPHMPHQVGELCGLRTLRLCGVAYARSGFEELRRLPALHALHLSRCRLPACLPRLSALRDLRLCGCVAEQGQSAECELRAGIEAALRGLTRLTSLALEQLPPAAACPPALADLQQLRALALVPCSSCSHCGGTGAAEPAPPGRWPPGLRSLTTTWALAAAPPGLEAAPLLCQLTLVDAPHTGGVPPDRWLHFWRWAESHPPLAQLEFAAPLAGQAAPLAQACAHLAARRPALRVAQRAPSVAAPPAGDAPPA